MTDELRPSLSALATKCRTIAGIYAGSFWRHYKSGDIYEVTGATIREADGIPMISYKPVSKTDEDTTGLVISRPASEWEEYIIPDDGSAIHPRFSRVHKVESYA